MREPHNSFITRKYLRSVWALDYEAFKDSESEQSLFERLHRWAARTDLKETSAEAALLQEFFCHTWGYVHSGQDGAETAFTLYPQFPVDGGSARGRRGSADAALGRFTGSDDSQIPQVLCEFKDIKSALDAPQKRKGNNRSPAQQGLDYLSAARHGVFGNEPIIPTWAIITDMNEFRLYWSDRGARQFIRFTLRPVDLFQGPSLLDDNEEARFDRFLFHRIFHRETLLVTGYGGRSVLAQLIAQQWVQEREIENSFYQEYRAFREHLYQALLLNNPEGSARFPGTRGRLVRMAQKILDRCIFIFFCEDMGRALGFPPQLLRNFIIHESNDEYFEPEACTIWPRLVSLFQSMNDGTAFGGNQLNQFNGGLFATDPALDQLVIPNRIFCMPGQGQNEASLYSFPLTLLYLSASYNYAAGWAQGLDGQPATDQEQLGEEKKRDPDKCLGLYTLGRIFEQSITELEILEAEVEGRESLNKQSKRKRDGVYYTPEWVVERIVTETVGERLAELKQEAGWPPPGRDELPSEDAVDDYEMALRSIKIVDPAVGSGAFLITALKFLIDEWHALQELRKQISRDYQTREGYEHHIIRDILRDNLFGVDINPASVEITKLALWLHTARGDQPLSSLDDHILDGNSLIGPDFYDGLAPYSDEEQERINAFDWEEAFPQVFEAGGFDVVIGNPPYVKLQNFRKVHADMASFLRADGAGRETYASTQSGNFDLFLPFIEKGISLLNDNGRLGYIAPSLWTMNEYGKGLRDCVLEGRHLYGWIDFQSHQIFEEATTYTALQFFSKRPNDRVNIAFCPDGVVPENPWAGNDASLTYDQLTFGDRWLLATGADRELIDGLYVHCHRLDDSSVTRNIFVGIQTSADPIYHLKRLGTGRYLCTPKGRDAPPPYEVHIEDDLMKPLVSGEEAKRYIEPATDTYLLFPYVVQDNRAALIPASQMATDHPLAWAYLQSWEDHLRSRENGGFDDAEWYRFGRHQNLDKQEIEKLIVPRLVTTVICSVDSAGETYLDNVDVGGVAVARDVSPFWLAGIINSKVCSFVFRRISKPFRGDFRSANKQFIAPLPIPETDDESGQAIANRAEQLQDLHTQRRNLIADMEHRLGVARLRIKPEIWLFPDLMPARELQHDAPIRLEVAERRAWAKRRFEQNRDARLAALETRLSPGVAMDATFENGELKFIVDGVPVIQQIFLAEEEGNFVLAQWKLLATTFVVTEKTNGKKLANALRKIGETDNIAVRDQIIQLQQRLSEVGDEIEATEHEVNRRCYQLYQLSDAEVRLVEAA